MILLSAVGCKSPNATIGEANLRYGMSKQELIDQVSLTETVVSTENGTVISEGIFAPTKQRARKIFTFINGKLAVVKYTIL